MFVEKGNNYELVVRALESEASSCSGRVKSVYFLSQRCGLIDSFAGSAASNCMACFSLFCGNNRMLWPTTEMRNLAFMFDRARFFLEVSPKIFCIFGSIQYHAEAPSTEKWAPLSKIIKRRDVLGLFIAQSIAGLEESL